MGVPFNQVTSALNTFMGSSYVNDFDFNNRSYRVYVQADAPYRRNAQDIHQYYVRSNARSDGPSRQPGLHQRDLRPTKVINHYISFVPPKSTAPPHQASLRPGPTPW